MNPALLNYLAMQSQGMMGAPNNTGAAPNPYGQQMPQGYGAAPMQNSGNAGASNPFDSGIQKAISSARQSLGMTRDQEHGALRQSLLAFGDRMGAEPKKSGFFENFGAVGRSLSPAIQTYDQYENDAISQNNNLANQILRYQAQEEEKAAREEERAWSRQFHEDQLAETRRYHDLMKGGSNTSGASTAGGIQGDFLPIQSKPERNLYIKEKKSSGEILHELSAIKKDYDKFRSVAKDDIIDPMTPYGVGKAANAAKDFFGYFANNKELQEETKHRRSLDAKLGKFNVELERKIKGGILSEGMRRVFENKGLLPSLEDRPEIFEEKLNNLTHEIEDRYKAAEASLRHNAHISPADLEQLYSTNSQEVAQEAGTSVTSTPNQTGVTLFDPDSGTYYDNIPADLVGHYQNQNPNLQMVE